jgi:acylglycerol lipase
LADTASATTHIDGRLAGRANDTTYWQAWLPSDQPRAILVIAHGALEHSGRYAHVAERLGGAGVATYAIDHRGHGHSDGRCGAIDRMGRLVGDLDRLVTLASERHPGCSVFLLGHSMGSVVALEHTLAHQDKLAGLVLSGSAIDVSAVPAAQFWIAKLLSEVVPGLGLVHVDSSEVSRDPAVVRAYDTDPLVHRGKLPARMLAEVLSSARGLPARVAHLRLPLLILHGTDDRLAAAAGARTVHDAAAGEDKTLKLYDGLYHEVLNEPEKDAVIADVIAWLQARS